MPRTKAWVSSINLEGPAIRGMLYPMGLSHHWRVFIELLSRELFSSPSMIKMISFRQFNDEEQVLVKE